MKDYTKDKNPEKLEPFFPNEMFRHIIVACFLVIVELAAVIVLPLPWKFIDKPDHIPWFLLPVYRIRNLIQHDALFIALFISSVLLFILWPFITDRKRRNISSFNDSHKRNNNLWQRPILFSIVITAIIFVITVCFINP
jgi:hypothetical protein